MSNAEPSSTELRYRDALGRSGPVPVESKPKPAPKPSRPVRVRVEGVAERAILKKATTTERLSWGERRVIADYRRGGSFVASGNDPAAGGLTLSADDLAVLAKYLEDPESLDDEEGEALAGLLDVIVKAAASASAKKPGPAPAKKPIAAPVGSRAEAAQ